MTTLKDVAKEVGVSIATVSYVLNGTGSVSEAVQARVHKAVKKLGYRPNRKAQAMRTGISNSIGMMIPDLTNPFFPELAQKVEIASRRIGFTVILFDAQEDTSAEEEGFKILDQHGVDGIIWCPVGSSVPDSARSAKCPIVLIDRPLEGFDVVQSDYSQGGQLLAEYAIKSGHRKIGLLSGPHQIESARQRRSGFLEAISDKAELVWDIEVPFSRNLPKNARAKLKEREATLILAADDVVAIGAMKALDELGLEIPADISIVGFDNIPWSTVVKPELTTINQPVSAIGSEAVALLVSKISNPGQPVKKIVLAVELIERDSVMKQ